MGVRHLTAEEIKVLLDTPEPTTLDGIRDRAMLYLCFGGELRVSELISLRIDQLTLHGHATRSFMARGARNRASPCGRKRPRPSRRGWN